MSDEYFNLLSKILSFDKKRNVFFVLCSLIRIFVAENQKTPYNMQIKRITCRSSIEAAALKAWLEEANINCVIYDETNSKVARGILDQTMDVMVRDEDWERANAIYEELLKENDSKDQETEA